MVIRLQTAAMWAVTVAGLIGTAFAQDTTHAISLLGAREQLLATFDKMPETQLKALFLDCSRQSSERLLAVDEAVPCAMAWDALLRRGFNGDIDALLTWWRANRSDSNTR